MLSTPWYSLVLFQTLMVVVALLSFTIMSAMHTLCLSHFLGITAHLFAVHLRCPCFPKKKKAVFFYLKKIWLKFGNRGWQPTDWKHTLTCLHGDTKVWRWLNVTNKKTLQRCKSLLFQGSRWVAEKYLHLFVSVFISSGIRNLLEDWDTVRKHNERV